jgi:hypothetical protein
MKKILTLLLLIFVTGAFNLTAQEKEISVKISVYNPVRGQTQGNPLETASGYIIDLRKLKSGQLRICAISRKLHKKYGGPFKFGDIIYVSCEDSRLDGYWVIEDLMGPRSRHENKVDLLFDASKLKHGVKRGTIRKK